MSTTLKEWLLKTIAELEEERDAVPGIASEDADKALAAMKIALGALEAEPIYQLVNDDWYDTDKDTYDVVVNSGARGRIVYTAPPAPLVPTFDEWLELRGNKPLGWVKDAMRESYDACRAAMLQGADGNAPVSPDGWVACSERMPEIGIKVLCFPVNDEPIHATYNGQVWLQDISWSASDEPIDNVISCNVFHWMPLPAAPQQEADNE